MGRRQRGAAWAAVIEESGGTIRLAGATVRGVASRPSAWVGETISQTASTVRRCWAALFISASFFIFGVGVMVAAGTLRALGAQDRLGQGVAVGTLREFAAWVTGMLIAGIAGTAICSELGARRVREELDALAVLGVDVVRTLVVPRVLALTIAAPLLYLWTVFAAGLTGAVGGDLVQGLPMASYLQSFQTLWAVDVWFGLLKMAIIGFGIGVICCYEGMTAQGGPGGVARQVNRAVVLAFVMIWVVNFLFNALYLGLIPSAQELR